MAKYDVSKLKEIFARRSGQGCKAFCDEAVATCHTPKKYATALYYKWKKTPPVSAPSGTNSPAQPVQQPNAALPGPVPDTTPVETVSPSDVKVETPKVLSEGESLRSKYANMFAEVGGSQESSEGPVDIDGGDLPGETVSSSGGGPSPNANHVKLGELFYQLGVAVNDNLLWPERHLTDFEKGIGHEASNDLESTFDPAMLQREDAPWINYAMAFFAVPTLSRIDLIPQRIESIRKFFEKKDAPRPNRPEATRTPEEGGPEQPRQETTVNGIPKANWDKLSQQQQVWINDILQKGYRVSPNFRGTGMIDHAAYLGHILKDSGDPWNG